jgi:Dolichyl-phosphate-mannose-protein mannosyltransferase
MASNPHDAAQPRLLRFWLAAVSLFLAAFAARVIGLGEQSVWYDEAFTALFARKPPLEIVTDVARLDLNTPLHYLSLKLWAALAGESEFAQRSLSVFAGMITAALIPYLAGREPNTSRWQTLLALAMAAVWPVAINLSQELRMYALAICLNTAALALLARATRTDTRRAWAAWAVVALGAFGAHVLGALAFAAQLPLVLHWLLTGRSRNRPDGLVAALCSGAAIVFCGLVLQGYRASYAVTYTEPLPFANTVLQSLAALSLPRLLPENWITAAAAAAVLALLIGLAGNKRWLAIYALLTVLLIALFCSVTGKFAARYVAFAVPPMLAAAAGVRLPRAASLSVIGIVLATGAAGVWQLRTAPDYDNDNYRDAVRFLRAELGSDEAVIFVSGHASPALAYYWPEGEGTRWHALPDDPVLNIRNALDYASAVPALNRALAGKRGAWLLLWQDVVIDPSTVTQTLLRRQAHKLQPDRATSEFHGLRLLHYTFDAPFRPLPELLPALNSAIGANGPDLGLSALGCHQFDVSRAGGGLMEVACFWRKAQSAQAPLDTKVSLRLNDAAGARIVQADEMLANFGLPYYAFDKPITTFHYIQLPDDAKAGRYTLEMILYTPDGEISPKVSALVMIAP